ncbi:MAG: sulfatase-like hydrolase/transferase [Pseudomonadota bacterium]
MTSSPISDLSGRRPSILMINTDQQRRDSVGAYGSPICKTPTTDRLAAQGLRFDNAYTPTGLCSPVRCSLLTGLYPHGHRVLTNVALHPIRAQLEPGDDLLANGLKAQGYRLGYAGKWHVSKAEPPAFGYDHYVSLGDFETYRREKNLPLPDQFFDYTKQVCARDPAPAEHSRPAFLADAAIEMIETLSGNDPFFVRLEFHGPHFPNVVAEPFFSMYPPDDIPPWPNADDPLEGKPSVQRIKQRHWRTENLPWSAWQKLISAYFGEISLIDAQIGRVLDRLDQLGLADDTLVICTTDHGDTIGAHGICNKDYTMYEEIYRVPMIMRWPGKIEAGGVTAAYTHHFLDLFATYLDVAGVSPPDLCHGRSLLPLVRGEIPENWPKDAYCQFHGSHMGLYSMRLLSNDDYAYIYHTNDIDELYDRRNDPHQLHNLAENPGSHVASLDAMKRRMVAWMAATDDHIWNEWTVDWLTEDPKLMAEAPGRRKTKW